MTVSEDKFHEYLEFLLQNEDIAPSDAFYAMAAFRYRMQWKATLRWRNLALIVLSFTLGPVIYAVASGNWTWPSFFAGVSLVAGAVLWWNTYLYFRWHTEERYGHILIPDPELDRSHKEFQALRKSLLRPE